MERCYLHLWLHDQCIWAKTPLLSISLPVWRAPRFTEPYDVRPNKSASWLFNKSKFVANFWGASICAIQITFCISAEALEVYIVFCALGLKVLPGSYYLQPISYCELIFLKTVSSKGCPPYLSKSFNIWGKTASQMSLSLNSTLMIFSSASSVAIFNLLWPHIVGGTNIFQTIGSKWSRLLS